ncbi:hypothetical protein GCM10009740_19550 [Terrabacter terrae]|uniref:Uncharacterized protein n=1 Tax=Terrabacter terrae TaxID=318434 RepID=A0ABP5FPN3_9MICO
MRRVVTVWVRRRPARGWDRRQAADDAGGVGLPGSESRRADEGHRDGCPRSAEATTQRRPDG